MQGEDKIALPVSALQHAGKSSKVGVRAQNGPDTQANKGGRREKPSWPPLHILFPALRLRPNRTHRVINHGGAFFDLRQVRLEMGERGARTLPSSRPSRFSSTFFITA